MRLENIQVEQISKGSFRVITNKGQYLQANIKLVAFIDNSGKGYVVKHYYSLSNSTIIAISKFFGLTRSQLAQAYNSGEINLLP